MNFRILNLTKGNNFLGGMWTAMGLEENPILTSSLLTDLSTHYDYFVPSVVLRWAIQKNVTVIPRSSNKNHLAQNLRALDTKISEVDIAEIDSMATILDDVLQGVVSEAAGNEAGGSEADGNEATILNDILQNVEREFDGKEADQLNEEGLNKDFSKMEDFGRAAFAASAEEQPNSESLKKSSNKRGNENKDTLQQNQQKYTEERPEQDGSNNPEQSNSGDLKQDLKSVDFKVQHSTEL